MSRRGRKNYIRHPDAVERIGSYLGTSFPLFHDVRSLLRPSHRNRPSTAPSLLRNLEMAPEDPSDVKGDVTMERQQRLPVDLELGREEAQHQKYFSLAPHKWEHRVGGHTRRHAAHHGHVSLGNVFREPGEEDLVRNVEISR